MSKECLDYIKESKRWLPCIGKSPKRINASSNDWNIIDNQYYAREVFDYKKENPSFGWGICLFRDDPIIVIDVDKLSDEGLQYIEEHNSFPIYESKELSSLINKLNPKDFIVEKSLSGRGLHIYILSYNIPPVMRSIFRIDTTFNGLCDHVEVFNGGSNEDISKGKFIVFTGNFLKDFTLEVNGEPSTPEKAQAVDTRNKLIYTDVKTLPVFTHKYPVKKLLDILLANKEFDLLYNKGILVKEQDLNAETLEVISEEVTDTSAKVFKFVSILVSHCQVASIIDEIFKHSFLYKNTHWGLEGKWERLIATHNNSNPILSAYNAKVGAARELGKPDYAFFKTPYTTEVAKSAAKERREQDKADKEAAKTAVKLNNLARIQKFIQDIIDENEFLYQEYKKIDDTFEPFEVEYIDLDIIENDKFLSEMYWNLYPFTFAVNNNSQNDWITYNLEKKNYELISRETLRIHITNLFMEIFPNKTHSFRKNMALATLDYYESLHKPVVDIFKNNSFLNLNDYTHEGYYYKVKNGILDVRNSKLLDNTPSFLSFSELPFEVDDAFLEALRTKDIRPVLEGTLFEKFISLSFPVELLQEEVRELNNNSRLVCEEGNIYKLANSNSSYRFSSQLTVLQRMLGYTIIPRHIYNSDKTLILYGVAGSGKSTLAKLLGYLLTGRKDLSGLTTTFSALEKNQYALAPFKTTPLIVVNELPDRFSNEIRGTLNALISGESVEVNEKFRANYSAQLPGKLVLIGNVLPKIVDASGSLSRRSVIVNFPVNVSRTEKAIDHIDDKLIEPENLRAFFLFCLVGALDVLENKYTIISKIGFELLQKMEQQNNPVEEVLKETTEFLTEAELKQDLADRNLLIPKSDLLNHIKEFLASSYNLTPYSIKTWGSVGSMCSGIATYISKHFNVPEYSVYGRMVLGSKNVYKKHNNLVECFRGIKLKNYIPETQDDEFGDLANGFE